MEREGRYAVVALGASLGGWEALRVILHGLRGDLPVPLVVAQHLGPSIAHLVEGLDRALAMPVEWVVDGGIARPGTVHICPPRSQVRLEPDRTFTVRPTGERSSFGIVDSLFTSVAESFGPAAMAVVLTGGGSDGTAGARTIREAGGTVVAQEESTAVATGMPSSVIAAGLADIVLSLPEITELLEGVVARGKPLPTPAVLAVEAIFAAGGDMGARMSTTDWSRSPLGPVERWSPVLRTTLATVLGSPLPMAVLWGADLLQLYNDAYGRILGPGHPEALGRPALSTWAENASAIAPLLRQVWESGRPVLVEDARLVVERDGRPEERFFTFSYSPLREGGDIVGVLAPCLDLTEKVRAARRLGTLHRLATAVPDAVADERTAGERLAGVFGFSDAAADLPLALLYLPDDAGMDLHLAGATGVEAGSVVAPYRLEFGRAERWPVASAGRRGGLVEVDDLRSRFPGLAGQWPAPLETGVVIACGRRVDGVPAAILIAGVNPLVALDSPLRSYLELVAEQIGAAVLVTRRHRDERARLDSLAALDRDKTVFFAGVSHEFRTPLTLTLGPLEQLLDDAEHLRPADADAARLAHRSALRLLKLVNTLLEFSALEERRARPELTEVDLAEVTADIASVFRSAVERAGLAYRVDCPPLGRPVPIDVEMWERIVLNLVSNALKHTFTGTISVSLRLRQQHVELEVADTGVGIPEADLPNLFTRFHRVRGARARSHEGSGLGLALVQGLVRLHRGTVRVRSTLGEGSRFTVWVPLSPGRPRDPAEPHSLTERSQHRQAFLEEAETWLLFGDAVPDEISPGAPPATGPPGRRPAVLLVDDNADMREYVRRLLADRFEVAAVPNGKAALTVLHDRSVDLVLTDVLMPEIDGLELLHAIRLDPRHRTTPVILLTAVSDPDSVVRGLAAGAHDYIVKPFTAREMIARVDAQLALARLRNGAATGDRRE